MSEELPEELLTSILLKLPIKTLLRCTSVCKAWYTLITSPYFINTHNTHLNFNNNNMTQLLFRHCNGHEKTENYALYCENEKFDLHTKFEFPLKSVNSFFRVIGSCNGLICLSHDYNCNTDRLILWNPFIKKAVYIPEPIYVDSLEYFPSKPSLGFGFDFATNDFKLVRITHLDLYGIYPKVEVYRLSTGIWEDISHLALTCYIVERSVAVYVNGAVHWIGWDWGRKYMVVFDMHSEVFREMMLPSSLGNHRAWKDDLFDCQGSLCLIHNFHDDRGDLRFDIWLMKEYGAAESWIKRFTVDISALRQPLGFRDNGEILWTTVNGYLISYHPQNKQMKDLGICGTGTSFYVGTCTESLVLLNRRANSCHHDDKYSKERREKDDSDKPEKLSK